MDESDIRRPYALYEIGVCNLARFGNPDKLNDETGLKYIMQAAQAGHLVARAYFARLMQSLGINLESSPVDHITLQEWAMQAAVAGFEAPFYDLTRGYTDAEARDELIRLRLERKFGYVPQAANLDTFKTDLVTSGHPAARLGNVVLHWAAQFGAIEHLNFLLDEHKMDVNVRNNWGDTALISACRMGKLSSAMCLLEHGADINLINRRRENVLHFIWKFTDDEAQVLLDSLFPKIHHRQQAVFQDAKVIEYERGLLSSELDPLPILPGIPIERVAARGRVALFKAMLHYGRYDMARDAGPVGRILLWATRLGHLAIYSTLASRFQTISNNQRVPHPIENATWKYNDKFVGFKFAAAAGWLSAHGQGWYVITF